MSKYKIKFGKKTVTLELKEHGFYVSRANKDNILYICSAETAESGNGKTYALYVGEDDNYNEIIETAIAMVTILEKEKD